MGDHHHSPTPHGTTVVAVPSSDRHHNGEGVVAAKEWGRRVVESGIVDRVDRVDRETGSIFGFVGEVFWQSVVVVASRRWRGGRLVVVRSREKTITAEEDIDNLTMEQYLALTRGNLAPGTREDTFFGNKNDDAHEYVEQVLDIASLFNSPGVTHDAFMLCVFYITLTGAAKRWVDRVSPGTEGDGTLYQTWERYNDLIYKCLTHDINILHKVYIFYNRLGTMNRQLLDSQGPIPGMILAQALTTIQTMDNHSQKWHGGSSSRNVDSSSNSEGITAIDAKLSEDLILDKVPQEEKENVSYYVEPYKPSILFPRHLKNHTKEALGHETMENLKKIKINRPLLKEIRQTDNYAKHIIDLVANKPKIKEEDEVRINLRLDFNNALADLGASINIMSFSMYKWLGMVKLEPINMVIKMADNTKCAPKGIVENLLVKINKFIIPVDFIILDMIEDFRMPIILGRPLLATPHAKMIDQGKSWEIETKNETNMEPPLIHARKRVHWCEEILHEKVNMRTYWASCDPYSDVCDGGSLLNNRRNIVGDMEVEDVKDPDECEEDKEDTILGVVLDKLERAWFNGTSEDEDDLEGIINYLEPKTVDVFIDLDNEAYNQRKCKLLRMTYRKPPPILIEKDEVTRYTIGPRETYMKIKVLGIDEMPRTRDNVATIRDGLMEEMGVDRSTQGKT
nr:hypothetical protein [Tanacetum cinerariifolium]